jgi:hypothetical protein
MARTIRAGEDEIFIKRFFIKIHGRKTAFFQTGMMWSVVSNRNSPNPAHQQGPASSSAAASGPAGPTNPIVQLLQSADMSDPDAREPVVAQMTQIEENRMDTVLEKAGE